LDVACSDPPQTVHVAFMSLRPLFFFGKGRHGERHAEEKESQEENQVVLKLHARAFVLAQRRLQISRGH
jgi:hypothetical protein